MTLKISVKSRVLREAIDDMVRDELTMALAKRLARALHRRFPDRVGDGLEGRLAGLKEEALNDMFDRLDEGKDFEEILGSCIPRRTDQVRTRRSGTGA